MEYVYQQARLAVCDRAQVHGVSTVVFDYQQELLWASSFEVARTVPPLIFS